MREGSERVYDVGFIHPDNISRILGLCKSWPIGELSQDAALRFDQSLTADPARIVASPTRKASVGAQAAR